MGIYIHVCKQVPYIITNKCCKALWNTLIYTKSLAMIYFLPTGIALVGGPESTRNSLISASNIINDYTSISPVGGTGLLFRCVTGLGPSGDDDNDELGSLYFNGSMIPNGECSNGVIQARGAPISSKVGVLNVFLCTYLTSNTEGVYTCNMRNSEMTTESMRVGVYRTVRSKYISRSNLSMIYIVWKSYSI